MRFEIRLSTNGQYYWLIRASNGQVLAASETYWNKGNARSAAASVQAHAGGAPIHDYA